MTSFPIWTKDDVIAYADHTIIPCPNCQPIYDYTEPYDDGINKTVTTYYYFCRANKVILAANSLELYRKQPRIISAFSKWEVHHYAERKMAHWPQLAQRANPIHATRKLILR